MESTDKYWIPVFNILEEQALKLAINYSTELNLLLTIPSIKEISAIFENLMKKILNLIKIFKILKKK